jgi:2,4-dienoyl-CoA reductase-like NADH-dependent reductase (Old Yellow Enzyme family)
MRSVTLKNRIVVSPMCQYSSVDGHWNDHHLVHLGQYALGGAGMIITEATAVHPRGRITPHCTGLWSDEHVAPLARCVDFMHAHQAVRSRSCARASRPCFCVAPTLLFAHVIQSHCPCLAFPHAHSLSRKYQAACIQLAHAGRKASTPAPFLVAANAQAAAAAGQPARTFVDASGLGGGWPSDVHGASPIPVRFCFVG